MINKKKIGVLIAGIGIIGTLGYNMVKEYKKLKEDESALKNTYEEEEKEEELELEDTNVEVELENDMNTSNQSVDDTSVAEKHDFQELDNTNFNKKTID